MINAPATLLALSVIMLMVHIFLQAFFVTKDKGRAWNAGPRDHSGIALSPIAGRAVRASANFRETYLAFLALMLMSAFYPSDIILTVFGGIIWLVARMLYLPFYLLGIPYIRSIIWLFSIVGLAIMFAALWR
ncbi:MAPEG family protein [Bartonella tamiae]|uniref:MAPEG family protein n=1 Tax=Bartonella tamiae Th239 TaxID=1094558 RepID=J0QZL1_9HYPH|nr:MAPEG family protein [Bartonella tamiae]EJF91596.1 hypothetical protein ME5_00291 [Bartonella tamiae Th239]EJF92420.1 hypothetical protein MEG_01590 [Bartonella tamiae Th307]